MNKHLNYSPNTNHGVLFTQARILTLLQIKSDGVCLHVSGPCSSAHVCLGCGRSGGYCSCGWEEPRSTQTLPAGNHPDPELRPSPDLSLLPPPCGPPGVELPIYKRLVIRLFLQMLTFKSVAVIK